MDRGEPYRTGEEDWHAVRRRHGEREPSMFGEQGVAFTAGARSRRQGDRGVDLFRPGERRSVRCDRLQRFLAATRRAAAGEAHLDVAPPRLPDPGVRFEDRTAEKRRAQRAFLRALISGSISSATASARTCWPRALGWIVSLFRNRSRRISPTASSTTGTWYSSPSRS